MAKIISASIDVTKIDKARLKDGKNGQKYYEISIVLNDEKNQWGQDVSIIQGQTEDERKSKSSKVYIGNGKTIWSNEAKVEKATPIDNSMDKDDLPF